MFTLSPREEGLSLTSQSHTTWAAVWAVMMAQIPAVRVAAATACMTQKILQLRQNVSVAPAAEDFGPSKVF